MIVSIVVAVSTNGVIGKNNKLPWHLPSDMKNFKKITKNHHVVMGRNTYESIGKPLPDRINIVLTKNKNYIERKAVVVVHSLNEALVIACNNNEHEVMIIGGAQIYKLAIPLARRIYMTKVNAKFVGDTYFPKLNHQEWKEVSKIQHNKNENDKYPYDFIILERN